MDEKLKFASFSHISLDIFKAAIYDKHHKPTPRKLSHRPSREPKSKTRETIHYSSEIPRRFFPRNHISKLCRATIIDAGGGFRRLQTQCSAKTRGLKQITRNEQKKNRQIHNSRSTVLQTPLDFVSLAATCDLLLKQKS